MNAAKQSACLNAVDGEYISEVVPVRTSVAFRVLGIQSVLLDLRQVQKSCLRRTHGVDWRVPTQTAAAAANHHPYQPVASTQACSLKGVRPSFTCSCRLQLQK